jgi:hypothetical protein
MSAGTVETTCSGHAPSAARPRSLSKTNIWRILLSRKIESEGSIVRDVTRMIGYKFELPSVRKSTHTRSIEIGLQYTQFELQDYMAYENVSPLRIDRSSA